jgi:hypothetical protein
MRVCADTFDGVDTDKAQRASKESKARLLNKPVWWERLFMMDVFMSGSGWNCGNSAKLSVHGIIKTQCRPRGAAGAGFKPRAGFPAPGLLFYQSMV